MARSKVKSRSHHYIANLNPQPMNLPSVHILHHKVSEMQSGQAFYLKARAFKGFAGIVFTLGKRMVAKSVFRLYLRNFKV